MWLTFFACVLYAYHLVLAVLVSLEVLLTSISVVVVLVEALVRSLLLLAAAVLTTVVLAIVIRLTSRQGFSLGSFTCIP